MAYYGFGVRHLFSRRGTFRYGYLCRFHIRSTRSITNRTKNTNRINSTSSPAPVEPDPDYYPRAEVPGLADYIDRCRRLNRDFEEANVVYNQVERMRHSNAQTVEVAITLRTDLPPQEILESGEAIGFRARVSCIVEARLDGADEEFKIQEGGWRSQSLLTSPTARWTWSV